MSVLCLENFTFLIFKEQLTGVLNEQQFVKICLVLSVAWQKKKKSPLVHFHSCDMCHIKIAIHACLAPGPFQVPHFYLTWAKVSLCVRLLIPSHFNLFISEITRANGTKLGRHVTLVTWSTNLFGIFITHGWQITKINGTKLGRHVTLVTWSTNLFGIFITHGLQVSYDFLLAEILNIIWRTRHVMELMYHLRWYHILQVKFDLLV
jgi:hypothetical protein